MKLDAGSWSLSRRPHKIEINVNDVMEQAVKDAKISNNDQNIGILHHDRLMHSQSSLRRFHELDLKMVQMSGNRRCSNQRVRKPFRRPGLYGVLAFRVISEYFPLLSGQGLSFMVPCAHKCFFKTAQPYTA